MTSLLATLRELLRIRGQRDVAATLAYDSADNSRSVSEAIEALDNNNTAVATASSSGLSNLISGYGASGYDEMIAADGTVRPHWQALVSFLEKQGVERGHATTERIQRRIVENGLTLDSFTDPDNAEQPWHLDLIPFILSSDDFALLERACVQRVHLYEALLGDLYVEQNLLSGDLLPSGLVFNDPSFLRPLHGIEFGLPRLTFLALDFVRDKDGQWHVMDTHAETLAGHGYALANRVVLAEVCSQLFRACNARRISAFYQELAQELSGRAGSNASNIAILGPSPDHETYLSHAYVARYLGYLLIEGADLKVVGDQVFHKTLAGLQQIDLLVRAVEGGKSDPLELDPSGFLGPAGLVESIRQNPALMANTLGTAIVENRGLPAYLAALSERINGEELIIPDTPRIWLGEPGARKQVIAELDSYLIRSAYEATARPGHAQCALSPADLEDASRASLIKELELNGASYVAQKAMPLATAPVWSEQGMKPKPTAIRLFAANTANGVFVMPGGLAMVLDQNNSVGLVSQTGQSSDVWVISSEPQGPHYSRWRISEEESQVQRVGARLPSRIADNLYWLGRYVERADWTMRVMRNALNRGDEDLRPIRRTEAAENAIGIIESKWTEHSPNGSTNGDVTLEDRIEELFSAGGNPYGIRTTFQNIRRLARQTRDRLSLDAWRLLNDLTSRQQTSSSSDAAAQLVDRLNSRIAQLAAFNGLMHENMTRNFGWHFMDLGRRLERASQMAELLRRILVESFDESEETERLAFLLETADSFMTYRSRYRFAPTFPLVLDLLLIDEQNPRSLAYQLRAVSEHMTRMPQASTDAVRTPEQRLALDTLTQVRLADIEQLRNTDPSGQRSELAALLDDLLAKLPELSDTISRRYFSLTEDQPQRVHTRLLP